MNALYQNTPNSFKGETVIAFELAQAGEAVVIIMGVKGKVVRTISGDLAKNAIYQLKTYSVLFYLIQPILSK